MKKTTSAFIAIVGKPNVGKSSILNKLIGQKIAIVSDKPQTTRTRISGIITKDEMQLVFIDTPGLHKPKNTLGEKMVKAVNEGMTDVDCCLLVVEADKKITPAEEDLMKKFSSRKIPAVLAINKIDLLKDKSELFEIIKIYTDAYDFSAVVPVSAKNSEGLTELLSELEKFAVESVHFFDDNAFTDQPERVITAEIIREKLLCSLDKEVPHGIAVDLERFVERDTVDGEPIVEVEATIICEKDSHKGIIIGKGGAMLKRIGIMARRDIEKFFGIRATVKLWVKVKEDWRNRQGLIHTFGLD